MCEIEVDNRRRFQNFCGLPLNSIVKPSDLMVGFNTLAEVGC